MTGARFDARFDALKGWLTDVLPAPMAAIAPASSDASFRRYFRVTLAESVPVVACPQPVATLIAMDAPPQQEDCRPYVSIARLLAEAGVHAPAIIAADLKHGFLLTTDLGTKMYLDALDAGAMAAIGAGSTSVSHPFNASNRASERAPVIGRGAKTFRLECEILAFASSSVPRQT